MATEQFQKGDVVQLKSGGPLMTVLGAEDGEVSCTWFDKNQELQSNDFEAEALNKVERSSSIGTGSNPKRNNYS